ncbi:LacI family DNA-binding transcriptional regulator [Kiritimatiella glycovorans]|uniref:LacI family transcriptional regulator n=1 Tax=Kiritimatiella glycovorans TaxID=1307763 RepID=A0A0G3EC94_9BACT|nr:LacI family DNA-binding transcriptional regulator [Kiritimatiella glycovorans]AKJ63913.1 LacI family transcriptional regulator [Kiritimatiella glycovorans]
MVSQRNIAERLGVSVALVSRVLSGTADEIGIAAATQQRVLETAERLGYVPNAAALSLKGKATRTVGVAVYDFNDPFFGMMIHRIQEQAHRHEYSLVLAGFVNRVPDERDLRPLHKHAIDALIIVGSDAGAPWLESFTQLPVVRVGHGPSEERSVRLTTDEEDAAEKLIDHLAAHDRRRLRFLSQKLPAHRLRERKLRDAARDAGLGFTAAAPQSSGGFEAGYESARRWPGSGARADALVCATDRMAMGALKALHERGIDVPGEVAVTGFDDIPFAAKFIPALTTVRQDVDAMAGRVFESLMTPADPEEILFPGKLVIRDSG